MTHVGTHPDILKWERNGLPEDKPEYIDCPSCGMRSLIENILKCDNCNISVCPNCWIWIPETGKRMCSKDCLIERIEELEREIKALNEVDHGNSS